MTISIKKEIAKSNKSSNMAVRLAAKLPTGKPGLFLGSGGFNVGLCFDGRIRLGRDFMLFASAGGAWTGHATRLPNTQSWIPQGALALEYRPNNRDSWLWQFEGSS